MSTTMPSSSSTGRRNVASTTNVAPWRRWAGPNTSPRKLWATIMWSRTVRLNTGSPVVYLGVVVVHTQAKRRRFTVNQAGHRGRELGEGALVGDQHVVGGIREQVEGDGHALGERAATGGCDPAHLARLEGESPGVEPL